MPDIPKERYFIHYRVGFAQTNIALFEVKEVADETLTVILCEDISVADPSRLLGLEAKLPKAGQEFVISRRHRQGKDLLDELRAGNVVPYYGDKLDLPDKEFYFTGTLFPYEHPSVKSRRE